MPYFFYLGKTLLPVTPPKLQLKISNQNKTVNLINDGEVNILKKAGLTEISFTALLPQQKYPFAVYKGGFKKADVFLDILESLKTSGKPFQFIVSRTTPKGKLLFDTNLTVSLEDYKISEDRKNGMDIEVDVKLKQYRQYGTKTVNITIKQAKPVAQVSAPRPAASAPKARTHTVKKGDCLWNIAKKYYGKGNDWRKIYNANKSKIKSPNLIYPGQVFTIP